MPMNPEIKRRWVQALRSGVYVQGTGYLEHAGKFCCLGVLAHLAVQDGACQRIAPGMYGTEDDSDDQVLPTAVCKWAGLVTGYRSPSVAFRPQTALIADDRRVPLTTLNDEGMSFSEIANLIEKDDTL